MAHTPVLLKEVMEVLNPQLGEFFIDGTVGSGGHAVKIFEKILPNGKLLGLDLDKDNLKIAEAKILTEIKYQKSNIKNNLILVNGNYADLPEILKKIRKADPSISLRANGLLLDLGFSSEQIEAGPPATPEQAGLRWRAGRGFSFLKNEILDMRYDKTQGEPAAVVVNYEKEKELADIIFKYGEERYSRRIAKKIVEERKTKRIQTTFELVEIIKKSVPANYEHKRIHPATRTFQALRIYVNDELGNLERLLKNLGELLEPKGRAAIISFHSLEDRLVKNYFREMAKNGQAEILTKKPIEPTNKELNENPRSRSAKLRALYKI